MWGRGRRLRLRLRKEISYIRAMRTLLSLGVLALIACEFSKSVHKDLTTGLSTRGDGLSCEDVYLANASGKLNTSRFTYGDKIFVVFDDLKGFKDENGSVVPGLSLTVTGKSGDTVLHAADLYSEYPQGIRMSPLQLRADLTVADPMHSTHSYTLEIGIWDQRGKGTFSAVLPFEVVASERITIRSDFRYDEVYLFSLTGQRVITDNKVTAGEDVYLLIEGLSGFETTGGHAFPGLSVRAEDDDENAVMDFADLFEEYSEEGVQEEKVKQLISAQLSFPGISAGNRYKCIVSVWDKKSEKRIDITTTLNLQ